MDAMTYVCPWATGEQTPCVLRDGPAAYADGACAGCDATPLEVGREQDRQRLSPRRREAP